MEHIRLTRDAKTTLRHLSAGTGRPAEMSPLRYAAAVEELASLGLARAARREGGGIEAARLTRRGLHYYNANPSLRNPVNWAKVWAIAAVAFAIAALAAVAAMMAACSIFRG